MNGLSDTVIRSVGSRPRDDIRKWADEEDFEPVPINYEIRPMTAIFKPLFEEWDPKGNLGALEDGRGNKLNSTLINQFFLDMTKDYCNTILQKQNCPNFNPKGCGLDDICPLGRKCKDDQTLQAGYKCLGK